MKKFNFLLICCLSILATTTYVSYGEEATDTSHSTEKVSQTNKSDTLEINTEKNQTYAKVIQGEPLRPDDFKATIESIHHLKIKKINFSDNQRANTSNPGLYKIGLTFSTTDGNQYLGKFSYLIENQQANIFLDDISYNQSKRQVSFKVSENTAKVFMFADDKIYTCLPDNNGFFEGKYNPSTLPKTLQFIALDDKGDYSDENIVFLGKKVDSEHFNNFSYQQNKFLIQGETTTIDRIQTETSKQEKANITVDAKGAFHHSYIDEPSTIDLTLDNKTNLEFSPIKRDIKTINLLKENDNELSQLREKRTKKTITFLAIIIVFGTILLFIRHYLSARRQN